MKYYDCVLKDLSIIINKDIRMNSTSSLEISYHEMNIIKLEPEFYKPGFPVKYKVKNILINFIYLFNEKV